MGHVNFEKLYKVVAALRHPDTGCPWDLEQNHASLLKFLLEESYEFMSAVESGDSKNMEEEIGDVLLQVLLHCEIAQESKKFDLESVSKVLAEKLIRRHPHVFEKGASKISTKEVKINWQQIKSEEKGIKENLIDQSFLSFPALLSANKIGKKTNDIGFDWDDAKQVAYKVEEEWQELKEEMVKTKVDKKRVEEELGDFLFSSAQLARHFDLDPEETLRKANKKFIRRFNKMEELIKGESIDINDLNQKEMDHYWNETKRLETKS